MPQLDAILAAEKFRQELAKKQGAAALRLINSYGSILQRLQSDIDALTSELDAMAVKGELKAWKVAKLDTLKRLQRQVESEVNRYAVLVDNELEQGAKEAVAMAQAHAKQLTQASLPGITPLDVQIMASWQSLDPAAVEAALGFLSADSPLRKALVEKLGETLAEQVGQQIVEGVALGYNPRKTAHLISKNLNQGLSWSLQTARTAQLNAYRESTRAAYKANEEIVPGWIWHAAKDGRVCMSCIAMDGTEHSHDEVLNDHRNGRCVALPKTLTYRDLGLDVDEAPDTDTWLASLPENEQKDMLGKRYDAWKKGEKRFSENGKDWFTRQPEAVQRQMMGGKAFDAWKSGKIKLEDLTQETTDAVWGKVRTVPSMKSLLGEGGAGPVVPFKPIDYGPMDATLATQFDDAIKTSKYKPDNIIVDAEWFESNNYIGAHDTPMSTLDGKTIYINPKSPYFDPNSWEYKEVVRQNWTTDPSARGMMTHELAHIQHSDLYRKTHTQKEWVEWGKGKLPIVSNLDPPPGSVMRPINPEWKKIADEVSQYAMRGRAEFVAEVHAGVGAGKKYSKTVMELFKDCLGVEDKWTF